MTEWDALVETATERGFRWQVFRTDRHGTEVLAGVFRHRDVTDVVVVSDEDHAHAYRVPTKDTDLFAPSRVYWWYAASPVWTLRALLTLPAPA